MLVSPKPSSSLAAIFLQQGWKHVGGGPRDQTEDAAAATTCAWAFCKAGHPPQLCSSSPHLSTRRMILPLRVLGNPGAQWMTSGAAKAPIWLRTLITSSFFSSSDGSVFAVRVQ